ncbi:MAG: anaerobic ribonucleoside-triphosphate reductase activating protein [Puniceicoccales bacterium]|jgi:pyruvate formate lyase activating enzyme|nr:anaerobic ribonucleoside-triphosphate reductase activating protein [Puniceicoccales bacterium]
MKIGGIQKISLIDFPGKISCVLFTQGCNFCCPFCHNESLVLPEKFGPPMEENEVFNFLNAKKGKIEAVVISGGEPTLQGDLEDFLKKIKELGFLTKLDTNGSRPEVLDSLYKAKLLDYVAMDIKHRFERYAEIANVSVSMDKIKRSVDLIKNSGVDYEFRTTVVSEFHTSYDIRSIIFQLSGAKRFVLQEFIPEHAMNKNLNNDDSIFALQNKIILRDIISFAESHIGEFKIRAAN